MSGIAGLASMLHFNMQDICLLGNCLSYIKSHGWMIFRVKTNASRCRRASTPLYNDWLVVSMINQVDRMCASIVFSLSFLIAGWLVLVGGTAI